MNGIVDGPQRNQLWQVTEIGLSFHQSIMLVLWSGGVFFPPDKDLSTLGAFFQLMLMAGFLKNAASKKDKRQRQLPKLLLLKSNPQLILALSTSNIQWCYLHIFPTSISKAWSQKITWLHSHLQSSKMSSNTLYLFIYSFSSSSSVPSSVALYHFFLFVRKVWGVSATTYLSVSMGYALHLYFFHFL